MQANPKRNPFYTGFQRQAEAIKVLSLAVLEAIENEKLMLSKQERDELLDDLAIQLEVAISLTRQRLKA